MLTFTHAAFFGEMKGCFLPVFLFGYCEAVGVDVKLEEAQHCSVASSAAVYWILKQHSVFVINKRCVTNSCLGLIRARAQS